MTTTRINARLDDEMSKKLAALRRRTGLSTTEIVRESLELYYARATETTDAARALEDFVASAEGPPDLSTNYKAYLTKSFNTKTRAR